MTVALLPLAAMAWVERSWLKSLEGRRILWICAALFIIHCIWAVVRSRFYDAAIPGTYWKDDHNYFLEARSIATAWSDGFFPKIWMKGPPPYLGTLHIGYHRPLATMFMVLGASTLVGLLLNAFCLSLMPLLCGACAKYLFLQDPPEKKDSANSERHKPLIRHEQIPLAAAVLTAAHPTQFYWASYLMKDAWTSFVFWAAMTLTLGAVRLRSIPLAVAAMIIMPYLTTVRIYAGLSILLGLALLPGLRISVKQVIAGVIAVGTLLVMMFAYTERGTTVYVQVRDSFAALAPAGASGPLDMLRQLASGIPRLFLSPYAWIILPEPTPMYGMYPGMWYMYVIGYPLGFAGIYVAVRHNMSLSVIPMAAFGLAALLFLTAAYGGNASRQRYYLEYIFLVFAALGLRYPSRPWIVTILALEIIWAVGQVIALKM